MLTALIEAEATILGFFGLIFVYALTSLDNRFERFENSFHRLEDRLEEFRRLEEKNPSKEKREELMGWLNAVNNLNKRKKEVVYRSLVTGSFLVLSFLLAILALGFPKQEVVLYLASFSVGLLLTSIFQMF